jgi:hypothetical protein
LDLDFGKNPSPVSVIIARIGVGKNCALHDYAIDAENTEEIEAHPCQVS